MHAADIQPRHQAAVWSLDPSSYQRHSLHNSDRNFIESNCYIDIWIEVVHALNLEVYPFLAFTLASDFEDDQWTFYKPSFDDLNYLYGFNVQEMYLWGPLHQQILTQLQHGKIVLLEADSFFLPDTQETDYRKNHVKTTIAIESIDIEKKTLGYFHNAGYYHLFEEDFRGIFHLDKPKIDGYLPPYCELVRLDRINRHSPEELLARSQLLLRRYVGLKPAQNPILRFKESFHHHTLPLLIEQGLEAYHQYAFGSLRQMGSCYEFTAYYLRALEAADQTLDLENIAKRFDTISQIAKALILKGARMVNRKTAKDLSSDFDEMARCWDEAMTELSDRFA